MKTKIIVFVSLLCIMSIFQACTDISEDFTQTRNPEIEYKELTPEEVALKNQLAEAAKIVAEIAGDEEVLNEIVATIKSQPRIMEDRVKFADLMSAEQKLKSENTDIITGKFAAAFEKKLNNSGLKSAGTLIESLTSQGVEVYIPYPIEDYPEGTEIVVTSNPIDNIYENIGYVIGTGEQVIANEELSETYPIVIITTPLYNDEELQKMLDDRAMMDQMYENFNKGKNKSSSSTDPISDWSNENLHFGIHIPKIYCFDDHVYGLFGVGFMYITGGTVTFDVGTKLVFSDIDKGTFGFSLPRKFERYANEGWDKGWFDCNIFLWQDWQPAITSNSITICIDTPNMSTTSDTKLSSSWLQKTTEKGAELSSTYGVSASCSVTHTNRDFIYCSFKWYRSRYKYDYSLNRGITWGEDGETLKYISGVGDRPALRFSTELLYVTYCEIW